MTTWASAIVPDRHRDRTSLIPKGHPKMESWGDGERPGSNCDCLQRESSLRQSACSILLDEIQAESDLRAEVFGGIQLAGARGGSRELVQAHAAANGVQPELVRVVFGPYARR